MELFYKGISAEENVTLLGRFPLSFNKRNIVREFLNYIKKEVEYTNPGKN